MNQHTVKAYGDELNQLTAEVVRMGGLAEAQVADAIESVARRDVALAKAVVERDNRLDALHRDIEKKAIRLIALRQPVASDLRRTLGAMKLASDLERTGDLAKNIAKRALILAEAEPMQPLTRSIERMGRLVSNRLREARAEDFDALILPGGFGAAKNLSDFASAGANCTVLPEVLRVAQAFARAGKPIGMMCIAPTMAAQIFGQGVVCTLGSDEADAAKAAVQMGVEHQACEVSDIVEDTKHKLVTTPAYMLAESISEAAGGIYKLVDRVLELTHEA